MTEFNETSPLTHEISEMEIYPVAPIKASHRIYDKIYLYQGKKDTVPRPRKWVRNGQRGQWKRCRKRYNANYSKRYRIKNKEKIKKQQKIYASLQSTKDRRNARQKKRRKTDHCFKLKQNLRSRLINAMNRGLKTTTSKTLLGCSFEKLKSHLESQFEPWMTWDNYGKGGRTYDDDWWAIDHIKPCAKFDFNNVEDQKKCFHFSNLQPLHWCDNAEKGDEWLE